MKINKSVKNKKEKELEKTETEKYLYIYGIINNENIKLNIKGLQNKPITKIDFMDLSVLTSFYPTLDPLLKEEEAMKHANTLKKIAKKITVIPMSFGMVFKDQEILERTLSKSYQILKETLREIDNKIELGVKIVKNQVDHIPEEASEEVLESLNKISIKSVKGENFSERLLLNYSFLVEKNNFVKFSDKIAELENKHKNLKFIYTGPWPPYSFIDIKVRGD